MAATPSPLRRDLRLRLAAAGVVVACAGFLAWMVVKPGGQRVSVWVDDLGELLAPLLAAIACAGAARSASGRCRRGWALMAASALSWGVGEAVWCWYALLHNQATPFPSPADVAYLGSIPLAVAGVLSFPTGAGRGRGRLRLVLDGLTIGAGLLAVSWSTVLGAVYRAGADSRFTEVLSLAYPVCDVVVATMLLILAMRTAGRAQPALLLLGGGLALTALADSAFAYFIAATTYSDGSWVNSGYVAGFLLVALAAVCSRTHPVRPPVADLATARSRPYLPYLPVVAALIMAVVEEFHGGGLSRFLFVTMLVLVLVVMARQLLTLADNLDLIRRLGVRERQLQYQNGHDPLTDLANRDRFRACVRAALGDVEGPRPGTAAVLFIDLDDFKDVNDSLGHQAGDRLLVAVAERLRGCVRPGDVPARLGGDEFAVLVTEVSTTPELMRIGERILEALAAPVLLDDCLVIPQASIGVAIAEDPGVGTDELLRRADVAMYAAKARGKGRTGFFEPSLEEALRSRTPALALGVGGARD